MKGRIARKGDDIAERLEHFGAEVLDIVVRQLQAEWTRQHVAKQLARSATSAGANFEEARGAESRADFIHKMGVAGKEMRETLYWLRLVRRSTHLGSRIPPSDLAGLLHEADELIAILTAAIRTAKRPP